MRLMVLHDVKNEDGIKSFFNEVYETFIKVSCPTVNMSSICSWYSIPPSKLAENLKYNYYTCVVQGLKNIYVLFTKITLIL